MNPERPLRKDQVLLRIIGDECLLYDQERGRIHILNAVAGTVWRMCDGAHGIHAIADAVREAYEVPDDAHLTGDVESVVTAFANLDLLESREPPVA
jgi:hypothetical protein